MHYNEKSVGSTIRRLRKERRLSQEVLSGLAGIGRTHLTMIENGTKQPNLETIWKIADALGISASTLIQQIETEMTRK